MQHFKWLTVVPKIDRASRVYRSPVVFNNNAPANGKCIQKGQVKTFHRSVSLYRICRYIFQGLVNLHVVSLN